MGQTIEPLNKSLPAVVQNDNLFNKNLIITDMIKIGRSREIKVAIEELEKRLKHG